MARRQRRTANRQQGASQGLPGWAMMAIGLIIGLFVAFLVYLDDLDSSAPGTVEQTDEDGAPGDAGGEDAPARAKDEQGTDGKRESPEFEFYSILPELEVVVPDGGGEDGSEPASQPDDGAAGDEAAPVEADGTFYLQAGSFQKAKKADRMKARIALLGLDVAIQDVEINGEQWHRVRVGPYEQRAQLRDAQQRLRKDGIEYLVLREKSSG